LRREELRLQEIGNKSRPRRRLWEDFIHVTSLGSSKCHMGFHRFGTSRMMDGAACMLGLQRPEYVRLSNVTIRHKFNPSAGDSAAP
jgi:hypothetical protein